MRVSDKRKMDLYRAISHPIVDARIALRRRGLSLSDDELIARIEHEIWVRVQQALHLTTPNQTKET